MNTRKRLTKSERENREGMMRKIVFARVLVVRRLIEAGWTNRNLADTWEAMEKEVARLVVSHSRPDHNWCDESEVAHLVTETMLAIQFDRWGEVIR
jgi:hypothetical protein